MADTPQSIAVKALGKLSEAVDKLLTLEVTTVVTELEIVEQAAGDNQGQHAWRVKPAAGKVSHGLHTMLRIDQGDITNEMTPDALDNEALAAFHRQQVADARAIISGNIEALTKLVTSLRG